MDGCLCSLCLVMCWICAAYNFPSKTDVTGSISQLREFLNSLNFSACLESILDCLGCRRGSQILQIIGLSCDSQCLIILSLQWVYWLNQQNPSTNTGFSQIDKKVNSASCLWQAPLGIWASFCLYYSLGFQPNDDIHSVSALLKCYSGSQMDSLSSSPFIFFSGSLFKRPEERIFRYVTLPDAHFQQCQVFYQAHHIKDKLKSCFAFSIVIFVWSLPVSGYSCGHIEKLSCSSHTSLGCSPADLPSQIHSQCLSFWLASCALDIHLGVCFVGNFIEPGAWNMRHLCTNSSLGQNPRST